MKNVSEGVEKKGTLLHCCKLEQPLWITVWRFLRKLNIELSYNPAISLLYICPEQKEAILLENLKKHKLTNGMGSPKKFINYK